MSAITYIGTEIRIGRIYFASGVCSSCVGSSLQASYHNIGKKFALKIAYKSWDDSYETLLLMRSGLQQLSECTSYLRLCYLFQIINGNFVFPNPPIVRRQPFTFAMLVATQSYNNYYPLCMCASHWVKQLAVFSFIPKNEETGDIQDAIRPS